MSKIKTDYNFSNLEEAKEIARFLNRFTSDLTDIVNGNLEFGSNIKSSVISINFTAANSDIGVDHGLGRVPTGYILVKSNAACSIYDGSALANAKTITLKSNAVANTKILVF